MKHRVKVGALFALIFGNLHATFPCDARGDPVVIEINIERSFHPTISIAIANVGGPEGRWIQGTLGKRQAGEDRPSVLRSTRNKLSDKDFREIVSRLERINFHEIFREYPEAGADGSIWRVSVERSGSSFAYSFWSPRENEKCKELVNLIKLLLEKAEIEVPDELLY